MLLTNKNAVIFGAGSSVASTIARAFAAEGARLFLSGPHIASMQPCADAIAGLGGSVEMEEVDALDEKAVRAYTERIASKAGSIDITFNGVGFEDTQNIPITEMELEDFIRPINRAMRTYFITAAAAGKIMQRQGSGVILSLTATPGGVAYPNVGGFGPACCAIEGFSRNLASELGIYGVRVINIRSAGSPDSRPFVEALNENRDIALLFLKSMESDTMLKQLPLMQDIADVAVFLASAKSAKITGVTIDVTSGTTGINHAVKDIAFVHK